MNANRLTFDQVCRISQDTTNELWSVTLRRDYPTPGAKKRAIEREVRAAVEKAIGAKSTTSGWSEDAIGDYIPMFGPGDPPRSKENPYSRSRT